MKILSRNRRIAQIDNGNGGMKVCNRVLCLGGRMRREVETEIVLPDGKKAIERKMAFVPLENVFSMELADKNWIDDLFDDPIPIPRWNAPAVLATLPREVPVDPDDPENEETETVEHDLIFLIGGRNENGLLADVDVLNLTTKKWETDWPDMNNKVRKQSGQ